MPEPAKHHAPLSARHARHLARLRRSQKISLYSWFFGSLCTIATEATQLLDRGGPLVREDEESEDAWHGRLAQRRKVVERQATVLVHAIFQVRSRSPFSVS